MKKLITLIYEFKKLVEDFEATTAQLAPYPTPTVGIVTVTKKDKKKKDEEKQEHNI